ncbi:MAG: head-tail connector protein [Rickettsiaceae bacterium]|nr:head-tail connector protein [Rickettsiaceae bacterium]
MIKITEDKTIISTNAPLDLEEMKQYLRITGNQDDNLLSLLLQAAICYVEEYVGIDLSVKEIISIYKVESDMKINLSSKPVRNIVHIKILGEIEDKLTAGKDYSLENSKIIIHSKIRANLIEVKYLSGVNTTPLSIKQAIMIYAGLLYDKEVINSESMEGIFMLLGPYRNYKL